jgi:hypothetical protein
MQVAKTASGKKTKKKVIQALPDFILEDCIEREFKLPQVPHGTYILLFKLHKSI